MPDLETFGWSFTSSGGQYSAVAIHSDVQFIAVQL